jgi:hypothetical protein
MVRQGLARVRDSGVQEICIAAREADATGVSHVVPTLPRGTSLVPTATVTSPLKTVGAKVSTRALGRLYCPLTAHRAGHRPCVPSRRVLCVVLPWP